MSQVLIISKTHLQNAMCVGGLELNTNRSIRLMSPGDHHYQPLDTPLNVGQVWEVTYHNHPHIHAPHTEDVIVTAKHFLRDQADLPGLITERNLINYRGHVDNVFGGHLHWTNSGSGYIPVNGPFPDRSVGFWISNSDLNKRAFDNGKVRYSYRNGMAYRNLSYVGTQDAVDIIRAGTIIRVSLSRVFPRPGQEQEFPNVPQGYYLQLSGWYTNAAPANPAPETIDDLPF